MERKEMHIPISNVLCMCMALFRDPYCRFSFHLCDIIVINKIVHRCCLRGIMWFCCEWISHIRLMHNPIDDLGTPEWLLLSSQMEIYLDVSDGTIQHMVRLRKPLEIWHAQKLWSQRLLSVVIILSNVDTVWPSPMNTVLISAKFGNISIVAIDIKIVYS